MSKQPTTIVCGALLALTAAFSHGDPIISYRALDASPKNSTIARCIKAVKDYHAREARLHLKHRARYFEQDGEQVLNLEGWVWKDGSRVKVSHQCVQLLDASRLALNVAFEDETQIAER